MKKSIKYILFLLFISLFMVKVQADEVLETCYYNLTGVAETGNKEKDAIFKVEIYKDSYAATLYKNYSHKYFKWYDQDVGSTVNLYYSTLEGYHGTDGIDNWDSGARKEFEKTKKCLDFLVYDDDQYSNEFYLYTYKQFLSGVNITDEFLNSFTDQDTAYSLITSTDSVTTDTCKYEGFDINFNKDGKIISINAGGYQILPTYDLVIDVPKSALGCHNVKYCTSADMSGVWGNAYLFSSSDGIGHYEAEGCTELVAKENAAKGGTCTRFNVLFDGSDTHGIIGLTDYANNYITCTTNKDAACISEEIGNYNAQKNTIVDWCNVILSNNHYDDGCLQHCLKLSNQILELEKKMGIAIEYKGDTCTLGAQLVLWIGNVIRWLKYIVPAIVVIFGILDFIKATGADKDDEIKKAQGKFVKRLIAAALVFIIPFIIEFILKIFDFEANGCGIINL